MNELRQGKGVEFTIDEESFAPEESSTCFEHSEMYRNSELYNAADSDSDDTDETSDLTPFQRMRKKMVNVTEDGGVMKRVLKPGMGPTISEFVTQKQEMEQEKPEEERRTFDFDDIQVAYHYSGKQEMDSEPFDVTYLRDSRPQKAHLNDEFFLGFRIAVGSMKNKEVADFIISPEYAFGTMGCPPRIKPDATLQYRIEMVNYWATTEIDAYIKMSRESKKLVPVCKLVKLCSKLREEANKLYNSADFKGAAHSYGKAIRILDNANLQNDEDEAMQQRALVKLYLNRCQCAIKLAKWDQAITYSNKVLEIEPKNHKALYRKATAKMKFGDYDVARQIALLARTEYPNDQSIGKLLSDIDRQKSEDKRRERLMCSKMFQVTGENKNEKSSSAPEHLDLIRKFQESTLEELKLNSASYTGRELDSLAEAASQLNLTVQKNKEKEKWISLTIKKIS
ncbi:FKBP6 [Bugula neritina]|uniref:peptidylprolyl isomerase n=1 Tax=Bugula neritina TaxID=10212 RepID=A0A7J7ISV8_BUGNE|nr:FKBP6 [Bugula neritina]